MKNNLTEGSILKNLIRFSLPFLLSYFLQTLYGMADLFIISRYNGTESITAVSIGSQVMHMLTVMIVGLAMGATVSIGKTVGAKLKEETNRTVGNTVTVFVIASVIVTVLLVIFTRNIVSVMSTPEEAVRGTVEYLTVCFIGIPFITAYNVISSVFRGLGDSKSPMYFVAVACLFNIVLDYIFIGKFSMGPMGAALGTTLSQTLSVVFALVVILKKKTGIELKRSDLKLNKTIAGNILKIGFPVAIQDGFIQIAFIVITVIANRRGLSDAAAVGIVEKIIGVLFLVPSSMLSSVSALAAQNIGAKKADRAKKTLFYAISITSAFAVTVSVIVSLFTSQIVGIFENNPEVIMKGSQYLGSYVWDCLFAGIHFCFSGYFCAVGRSGISFLHNFLSIVLLRVPVAYFASKFFTDTLFPMGLAAPAGSLLSVVICFAAYLIISKKENKSLQTIA